MTALPDGEYVLTEHVASPLPARLQTRRRGWMRAPSWPKDTHFIIKAGQWTCYRHCGSTGSAALSARQRDCVFQAVRRYLQLWAPTLPSHIATDCAESALDFLFVTGKITLDDVREAAACHDVGNTIGWALEGFFTKIAASAPPSQVPATPGGLRVGDVIRSVYSLYVVCALNGAEYMWQGNNEQSRVFAATHEASREPVIGHVADMLTEGLRGLHGAPTPTVAFIPHGRRTPSLDAESLFSLD